jgi:hypothetical protein
LEPDPELEPELPFVPEPMFGHGCFPGDPDFAGAGVDGVDAVGADVVGVVVVLEGLGAAAAPAMPETAPPAASAPATIVAPSSLDVFMRSDLLCRLTSDANHRAPPR